MGGSEKGGILRLRARLARGSKSVLLEGLFGAKTAHFCAFMRVFAVLEGGIFQCFQRLRRVLLEN
jgi:hypothetical protein